MLEADKKIWFDAIFSFYNRNLIKRRFNSLRIENFDALSRRSKDIPLIIYANHSSWWDGLVFYEILRKAKIDGFVMMEEKQLKNLHLFRKIGAFSVVRENPRKAVESMNYAVTLLRDKVDRALLIFPQGEIKPNEARPLQFYNGLSRIVQKLKSCDIVPVALRYEFLGEFKPEIFVKIGEIQEFRELEKIDSKELTKDSEIKLTNLLNDLKGDIAGEEFAAYNRLI